MSLCFHLIQIRCGRAFFCSFFLFFCTLKEQTFFPPSAKKHLFHQLCRTDVNMWVVFVRLINHKQTFGLQTSIFSGGRFRFHSTCTAASYNHTQITDRIFLQHFYKHLPSLLVHTGALQPPVTTVYLREYIPSDKEPQSFTHQQASVEKPTFDIWPKCSQVCWNIQDVLPIFGLWR